MGEGMGQGGGAVSGGASGSGAGSGGGAMTGGASAGASGGGAGGASGAGVMAPDGGSPAANPDAAPAGCEPDFAAVFPQDRVVEIQLDFADGDWNALLRDWDQRREKNYYQADLRFGAESLTGIGVRLKGFSSLEYGTGLGGRRPGRTSDPRAKFPLKLDFNRFGQLRFHCLDRVNLGNNWADITFMRERLAARMYNAMGVPAARTAYAKVTVEGVYLGLYTLTEQIDKRFLRAHFGELADADDGNLYKSVLSAERAIGQLVFRGESRADYVRMGAVCPSAFEECGITLKTNEDDPKKNDYADLIQFLRILNQTPDEAFEEAIAQVFDVDTFLRLAAVTVAIANPDSYFGMGHNYYLYHRPDIGRFVMLPWDLNEAYAGHPCGQDFITYDFAQPVCAQNANGFVLARRILAVPRYRQQYRTYVREVLDKYLTREQHEAWIAELDALIGDEMGGDPNYIATPQDYEIAISDQLSSPGEGKGGHGGREYNLLDLVVRKRAALLRQF